MQALMQGLDPLGRSSVWERHLATLLQPEPSTSKRGNCWGNAGRGFWKPKRERIKMRVYTGRKTAVMDVSEYIEGLFTTRLVDSKALVRCPLDSGNSKPTGISNPIILTPSISCCSWPERYQPLRATGNNALLKTIKTASDNLTDQSTPLLNTH